MKKFSLILLTFLFVPLIFSEEINFRILNTTNLYDGDVSSLDLDRDLKGTINKDEKVIYYQYGIIKRTTKQLINLITTLVTYNNQKYEIACNDLVPWNSKIIFNKTFITDLNSSNRKMWLFAHYIDVLKSGYRENLFDYAPFFNNPNNPAFDTYGDGFMKWYDFLLRYLPDDTIIFSNSGILINGNIELIIEDISMINDGYNIKVRFFDDTFWKVENMNNLNLDYIKNKDEFNLLVIQDGDYLDVFFDDKEHKFISFVSIDQSFLKILETFFTTGHYDISSIKNWPRRGYKTAIIGERYRTIDNVRLRTGETTSSNIITTLQNGTEVTILNKGKTEKIDNIEASWVQVKLENGSEGWCFGGYLSSVPEGEKIEPIENTGTSNQPKMENIKADVEPETPVPEIANTENNNLMQFIIFGIVVFILLGSIVIFIIRKKK